MKIRLCTSTSLDEQELSTYPQIALLTNPAVMVKARKLALRVPGTPNIATLASSLVSYWVYNAEGDRVGTLVREKSGPAYTFLRLLTKAEELAAKQKSYTDPHFASLFTKEQWKSKSSVASHIPPANVAAAASKSLEWRKQYGRAMTPVGIARARQLKNRQRLSLNTIKRMVSYFARHEVDKQAKS